MKWSLSRLLLLREFNHFKWLRQLNSRWRSKKEFISFDPLYMDFVEVSCIWIEVVQLIWFEAHRVWFQHVKWITSRRWNDLIMMERIKIVQGIDVGCGPQALHKIDKIHWECARWDNLIGHALLAQRILISLSRLILITESQAK